LGQANTFVAAGAGTIAQSAVATLVTFGFFAASYREQPFNTTRLNSIKVFSEFQVQMQRPWLHCHGKTSFSICAACDTDLPNCQVFGILLVSLLLQANKAIRRRLWGHSHLLPFQFSRRR
jgi:hypothetical protein